MRTSRELMVVETFDGQAFIGRIRREPGCIRIFTGFRGHPKKVYTHDVASIVQAKHHPDVR